MFSTRIKILVGYALLAIVLLSATWMIYDNTRSLTAVNSASERLMARRDIVDTLVFSMLETANAERSILLGDASKWQRFDHAISNSTEKARQLRPLISDSLKRQRLDTLVILLKAKRQNTMLVMEELGKDNRDIFYSNKMKALHSGRDSVVIHPRTAEQHYQRETVYEIVKTKKGFFRRLGDAFRRQHTDTVGMTRVQKRATADTVNHRVDIADSVANALAEIQQKQQRESGRQKERIAGRNSELQRVSILLAWRTGQLLEDIQNDEHTALRRVVDKAMNSRRTMIMRIAGLGLLAILSAAILVVYILRDIRRERRDRQRIIEAKAETERIMQQRERLLLTITHDIKAPAASIAGFIDLLAEYVDRPKAIGYLKSIGGSAQHLLQLVTALLDYHQLESGKVEIHEESFSPATLIRECVGGMQPQALEKGLLLESNINVADSMVCRSDAFRIKQIVNNLVGNAIKYTDEGKVTVSTAYMSGRLTIGVADTGCGMTPEEQQRVFNAFTRLPGAQCKEGVGLGLSIAREIVERLGGSINLVSRKGEGSKFTVVIPMETANGNDDKAETTIDIEIDETAEAGAGISQSNENRNSGDKSLRILIVDDDKLQQQLLLEMFARVEGILLDITSTTHACEAIQLAHDIKPDIVFTDIEMPEMNGNEIMKRIRENRMAMKFVAITAHEPSIMPKLRNEGFDACLFKPFSVQTLAATICQITGHMVRVKEKQQDSTADSLRSALLPFTDGDAEAERQIITDICRSIDEYLELLGDADNSDSIAKAAHKAMPLLEMIKPGSNSWLTPITPEHIAETGDEERMELTKKLAERLKEIKKTAESNEND
ncbi:MAG: hybrid sensor histidine kinase/response regulator [Prevotella pectinovora]|uniref:ATP-binding response regulator n=1 Tax=Prevotella pectinovora TaxID=1602169 RepID=UPI002E79B8AD|nr:hybrid sensor histidine kinase/response regulator [Prevotella pectinovora]MEE1546204.1 hybrid sensor histidine kinase/response regulator [Prevotella pectinovora]